MTQRELVGGIQVRMAEVRDLGVNLGCVGGEDGSKVRTLYIIILFSQRNIYVYKTKFLKVSFV